MRNKKAQSALLVAGAAVGVAAATWLGKRRHLTAVDTSRERMIEPERAELRVGRSVDPAIEDAFSRSWSANDETSETAVSTDHEPRSERKFHEMSLDEVWNAMPGFAEGAQSKGYDAVSPDVGAVWLQRAPQTTHDDANAHSRHANDLPPLDHLAIRHDEDEIKDDDLDE